MNAFKVEVKLSTSNFGKLLEQALGYSLFAHKCYLAIPMRRREWFTSEQRELATRLGVGLIEIRGRRAMQCAEVLSSQYHERIDALTLRALWNMNYFMCALCGTMTAARGGQFTTKVRDAIRNRKMLYFNKLMLDGKRIRTLMFKRTSENRMHKTTFVYPACVAVMSKSPE